jgi:hypothetical protein
LADEKVYTGIPPSERQYSGVPVLGGLEAAYSYLAPVEYPVIEEPRTVYTEDMGRRYTSTTPGVYGEPRPAVPAAIQGGIDFFKQLVDQPGETASAVVEGIASIPKEQMLGAQALMEGADYAYDPETNEEYRFDPFLAAAPVAGGTAISIARTAGDTGEVLGIMAGRRSLSGADKEQVAKSLRAMGKSPDEIFRATQAFFDSDVLGSDTAAFRFEIPTANSKFKEDGPVEMLDVDYGRGYAFGLGDEYRKVTFDEEGNLLELNKGRIPTVGEIFDFPELYEQYPEIKDVLVVNLAAPKGEPVWNAPRAMYASGVESPYRKPTIGLRDSQSQSELQSSLLHELQHWVQTKESFPEGASGARIMALIEEKMGAKMDPDFLKSAAYAAYESVYGEAEARNVQRRFSDFRKAELNPVETRRAEAPDNDITMSEDAAAEAAADMVRESLEYGDYSYEDVFPDAFKGSGKGFQESRPTAPKSGATPQDFEFYQDNPAVSRPDSGKEWLESNIRFTEERYADREPSMLRGPITANLGSRNTDMFLSTDELTQLPGAMGETRGPGDPNFDRLLEQIKTEGFDPDQAGNKVVVGVNHKGEAYLMEGNTRAAVAKELGIPNIKTEVRYWNGGEMIDGPYKPEAVAARAVVNKAEGGVITLADVARNMNRGPRGVAALAPIARNMNRPMVS